MNKKGFTKIIHSDWTVPLSLLVLCVLAYGLLIPTLGYYWDDWPYAWINHMFGPKGYPEFVSSDRPHSAWIFMILTTVWGGEPLGYHISGLLLYWLCAVLFWRFLRIMWPKYPHESLWAALLFTIYPGFLGHPNAIIYNHHFTAMALYLFSFIGMVRGIENSYDGKGQFLPWYVPAVLAMILSQFSLEYFLGWEAVRPIIVWLIISKRRPDCKQKIRTSLKWLSPFWIGTFGFLFWRIFILKFPTYQPLGAGEVDIISRSFFYNILKQIVDVVFVVWSRAFPQLESGRYSQTFWMVYLALIATTTILTFFMLNKFTKNKRLNNKNEQARFGSFGVSALAMAVTGILFSGWPFWLAGLPLRIASPTFSRFTLSFIPWVVLLLVAILHLIYTNFFKRVTFFPIALIALLVGGSTGWHLWNANLYQNDWIEVQRYIQQMVRRMPGLEPGTTILVNDMNSLNLYSDNSLTAVVNWTYAPENVTKDMDYMVYYLSVRLGRGLPALEPSLPIEQDYRSLHFSGTTDKLLVVYYQPPGCLRVLDNASPYSIPEDFPQEMIPALPFSNLNVIQTEKSKRATPPLHLFDMPPEESWCFYFEQADLAGQRGDWAMVADLGEQAYAIEDRPNEITENFIFIEGYLRTGQFTKARDKSVTLSEETMGSYNDLICALWSDVKTEISDGSSLQSPDFCFGE